MHFVTESGMNQIQRTCLTGCLRKEKNDWVTVTMFFVLKTSYNLPKVFQELLDCLFKSYNQQ